MINPVVVEALPLIQQGVFRRELRFELQQISEQIQQSGLARSDEMTAEINSWRKNFIAALDISDDAEAVCEIYIGLLQDLLTDPISGAPLCKFSVRGNDGYTYGMMSLEVYALSMPAEYQDRSPMDPNNPRRFAYTAHPVVQYMTRWLEQHDALLYSEELERAYLDLLPGQRPIDIYADIDRILARKDELDRIEREQRGLHVVDLAKRLERMAADDEQRVQALQGRIDGRENPLQALQTEVEAVKEDEARAMEIVKNRIEEYVGKKLDPLMEQIETHAKNTLEHLETIEAKDSQALEQLKAKIQKMQTDIDSLKEENKQLTVKQTEVAQAVVGLKQEAIALQKNINETKIAVEEMKKRSANQFFQVVMIVGVSCFATWAISALAESSTFSFSVAPTRGGGFMAKGGWAI